MINLDAIITYEPEIIFKTFIRQDRLQEDLKEKAGLLPLQTYKKLYII